MHKDFEDLSDYALSREKEEALLRTQSECTFIWSRKDGWPVGVTMTYIYRDGKIWMTTSGQHPRVLKAAQARCSMLRGGVQRGCRRDYDGGRRQAGDAQGAGDHDQGTVRHSDRRKNQAMVLSRIRRRRIPR